MRNALVLSMALVVAWVVFMAGCKSNHTNHASHSHAAPASGPASVKATYTCPMHPEVVSTDPNAKCPKCGMALVKKAG